MGVKTLASFRVDLGYVDSWSQLKALVAQDGMVPGDLCRFDLGGTPAHVLNLGRQDGITAPLVGVKCNCPACYV